MSADNNKALTVPELVAAIFAEGASQDCSIEWTDCYFGGAQVDCCWCFERPEMMELFGRLLRALKETQP